MWTQCKCAMLLFILCLVVAAPGFAQEGGDDRTLSPYFFVHDGDPSIDKLPLQNTRADVDIAGVIARVRVTQVYKNDGNRPVEATYVFPASTRAAVFGMRMTIGERVIEARISEREQARKDYEEAKAAGKSATLLEQQRPNVFQMHVANIMPADIVKVELDYTELLVPEDGTYEFVYPTVVGPRYSTTPREGASSRDKWVENPFLREGEPEPFTFDINVSLNSGIPVSSMACVSHEVDIQYDGPNTAVVSLKNTKGAGTKDFILRYNLEGDRIQSGVLLYPGEDENFFLVMMEPPARVLRAAIPPREYIFVLDVSGSMHGFPLNTAKELMRDLIAQLDEKDTFNVVLFSGRAAVLSQRSLPATQANVEKAMNTIDNQQGGGGTELINALATAFALPRQEEDLSRTTVIVTDGYVNCEVGAFDLIRQNLNKSNVFAFGIGSSVNRHLIEGIAHCGRGEPLIVTGPDEAATKAGQFRTYIQEPVLTQIEIDYGTLSAYDVEPVSVPDVLANRPVIVFGKYKGESHGTIRVKGFSGAGKYDVKLDVEPAMEKESNSALRYLWARHRIKTLSDYNNLNEDAERVRQVTTLGLTYTLLTDYTSFVAIDSLVRNQTGDSASVAQPLPLPDGVSNLAVGGGRQIAAKPAQKSYPREDKSMDARLSAYSKTFAQALPSTSDRSASSPPSTSFEGAGARREVPVETLAVNDDFRETGRSQTEPAMAGDSTVGSRNEETERLSELDSKKSDASDVRPLHCSAAGDSTFVVKILLVLLPVTIMCILLMHRRSRRKVKNEK